MNPARLALRNVLFCQRALLAALVIAASLCVLDLFAGHIASERAFLEYQAVFGERLGHLEVVLRQQAGSSRDASAAARIRNIVEKTPGITLVVVHGQGERMAVYLADPDGLESARATLTEALRRQGVDADVRSWRERPDAYAAADSAARTKLLCVTVAVLAVIGATIAAATTMNTLERRSGLATLRALGMRPVGVFSMIALEALWITIFATVPSLAATEFIAWIVNSAFAPPSGLARPRMLVELDAGRMLLAVAAVLAVALLAALPPALRAARAGMAHGLRWDMGHAGW